jgi:hypothetical protein
VFLVLNETFVFTGSTIKATKVVAMLMELEFAGALAGMRTAKDSFPGLALGLTVQMMYPEESEWIQGTAITPPAIGSVAVRAAAGSIAALVLRFT